jgi:two-component system, OmpR family, response regulator ChvI
VFQLLGTDKTNRILVVDDEPDLTVTFRHMLEKEGFQVDTFNDPTKALAHYRPGIYDLLMIDIRMPQMNGFTLYRELSKIDNKPIICFITAFEIYYKEFHRLFPNLDVKCFLRKPISGKDLIERINSLLGINPSDKCNSTC